MKTLPRSMMVSCVLGVLGVLGVVGGVGGMGCVGELPGEGDEALAAAPRAAAQAEVRDDCEAGAGSCVRTGVIAGDPGAAEERDVAGALPSRYPFWLLQLNLCNSGFAGCYQGGKSIPEAQAVIQSNKPDVVTLNEICENDIAPLASTLASVYSGGTVVWAFKAANDRRTNAAYKCKNGQSYGIGILAHVPGGTYTGHTTHSGIYASQDTGSNEMRAWVCLAATGNYYACTTHLATVGSVALNQCKHLMSTAIPSVRSAAGGYRPTVMGGDLNLKYNWIPDAQSCVPSGYYRKGDGDVQHVMATTDLAFSSSKKITLAYSDHPGWFVALTAP